MLMMMGRWIRDDDQQKASYVYFVECPYWPREQQTRLVLYTWTSYIEQGELFLETKNIKLTQPPGNK